jgi:hypothetical protein
MPEETYDIVLGARISKRIQDKILAEQERIGKLSGIKPSINEVVRMLIEKGLEVSGKRR